MNNIDVLYKVCEELDTGEVSELKFLCKDHIQRKKLENVLDAKDLVMRLEEHGHVDDLNYVAELLFTIKRFDLLKKLGMSRHKMEELLQGQRDYVCKISPYRKFLYELSEDVTDDRLDAVKFLIKFPRARLDSCKSFLDLLTEMEKQDLLSEDNFEKLENVLDKCSPQLATRLRAFAAQREGEEDNLRPMNTHVVKEPEESQPQQESLPGDLHSSYGPRRNSDDRMTLASDAASDYMTSMAVTYSMKQRPRGHCLIINNYDFAKAREKNPKIKDRKGTQEDADKLRSTFQWLHFDVHLQNDLTGLEIVSAVQEFGSRDHGQLDAFVCCVLSHGEKGSVTGTDGQQVPIRNITQPFTSSQCPSLAGKPKLFFIQACQGQDRQRGMKIQSDGENADEVFEADTSDDQPDVIPDDSDFLLGMATVENYQSFRNIKRGSIYIQELCRQLEIGCCRNENILNILTHVNREVSFGTYKDFKQMPEPRYTLTKMLILPVN